ncbi:MAG: hypothetical protein NTY65_03945 [Planctomycetota bacterium]|nr:hypothetical protein [Planctomycetota bacterium]
MDRAFHSRWTPWFAVPLLASLAISSGGCIVLLPTIPCNATGYGHTYRVLDEDGKPVGDGLLFLLSEYEVFPMPRDMYGCYEIKDGQAVVPSKVAVRAEGACSLPPVYIQITWSNPTRTTVCPLVPGYVPVCGYWHEWTGFYRFNGTGPPDIIRMFKADPAVEIYYLYIIDNYQSTSARLADDSRNTGDMNGKDERLRDAREVQRFEDYVAARLKELGYDRRLDAQGQPAPWRQHGRPL